MISAWRKIKNDSSLKEKILLKSEVIRHSREFFHKENFIEIDTPTLVNSPDPSLFNEVLEIESQKGERLFLTPSPEFFLKKALVAGFKNIYQITKAYRDKQEEDSLHLKEFTILEWYRDNANYLDLMRDCENLIRYVYQNLTEKVESRNWRLDYQEKEIDLTPPWPRISCKEAFKKYAGIDLDDFLNLEKAREICKNKGYQIDPKNTWEELYHQIFLNEIEPELLKMPAVILYDYPAPLAALSQIKKSDPKYAERFEFYLVGLEMGNGYSELTDWKEQERRLINNTETRKEMGMKVFDYDHDFVEALKEGMPKTAGIAVGLDRLAMFFTNSSDIREVTPFGIS